MELFRCLAFYYNRCNNLLIKIVKGYCLNLSTWAVLNILLKVENFLLVVKRAGIMAGSAVELVVRERWDQYWPGGVACSANPGRKQSNSRVQGETHVCLCNRDCFWLRFMSRDLRSHTPISQYSHLRESHSPYYFF